MAAGASRAWPCPIQRGVELVSHSCPLWDHPRVGSWLAGDGLSTMGMNRRISQSLVTRTKAVGLELHVGQSFPRTQHLISQQGYLISIIS